jgi:hypothetical protein
LVRSHPFSLPIRARMTLGDRNQYEIAAMCESSPVGANPISANFAGNSGHRVQDVAS